MDAVGNTSLTNIIVVQSPLVLTINPVADSSQLWQPTVNVTGTISDPTYTVWVNGVKGVNYGKWLLAVFNVLLRVPVVWPPLQQRPMPPRNNSRMVRMETRRITMKIYLYFALLSFLRRIGLRHRSDQSRSNRHTAAATVDNFNVSFSGKDDYGYLSGRLQPNNGVVILPVQTQVVVACGLISFKIPMNIIRQVKKIIHGRGSTYLQTYKPFHEWWIQVEEPYYNSFSNSLH